MLQELTAGFNRQKISRASADNSSRVVKYALKSIPVYLFKRYNKVYMRSGSLRYLLALQQAKRDNSQYFTGPWSIELGNCEEVWYMFGICARNGMNYFSHV